MHADNAKKESLKQKVVHESREDVILAAYLAFFFCALATYSMLLLGKFHISYFAYGTALINALVIAKVILIGEALYGGTKYEEFMGKAWPEHFMRFVWTTCSVGRCSSFAPSFHFLSSGSCGV